jgi:hypothetical protein
MSLISGKIRSQSDLLKRRLFCGLISILGSLHGKGYKRTIMNWSNSGFQWRLDKFWAHSTFLIAETFFYLILMVWEDLGLFSGSVEPVFEVYFSYFYLIKTGFPNFLALFLLRPRFFLEFFTVLIRNINSGIMKSFWSAYFINQMNILGLNAFGCFVCTLMLLCQVILWPSPNISRLCLTGTGFSILRIKLLPILLKR